MSQGGQLGEEFLKLAAAGRMVFGKVEIMGNIFSVRVDSHTAAPRENGVDAVFMEVSAGKRRQLTNGHDANLFHSGFPFLLGRRRPITRRSRSLSG